MSARLLGGAGLVVIFLLLLPDPQPLDVVLGVLVAAVALTAVGPSPLQRGTGRPSPVALVRLVLWVLGDLARGTAQVAAVVVGLRTARRPGVVPVEVGGCSEQALVLTGLLLTISPGSVLVAVDAERACLDVHVVDAGDPERVRAQIRTLHDLVLRTVGG